MRCTGASTFVFSFQRAHNIPPEASANVVRQAGTVSGGALLVVAHSEITDYGFITFNVSSCGLPFMIATQH